MLLCVLQAQQQSYSVSTIIRKPFITSSNLIVLYFTVASLDFASLCAGKWAHV